MAFQGIIDAALNPIFGWLLNVPPIVALLFLSVLLGLISILFQKYTTNQSKLKRMKEDTKKFQKQIKVAQKEKDNDKVMKINGKMMPLQMEMMKESFKPLMFTMIPFLIIFFWLSMHFAFYPVVPGEPFTVTAEFQKEVSGNASLAGSAGLNITAPMQQIEDTEAVWTVTGEEGLHSLTLTFAGAEFERDVLITTEREYIQPLNPIKKASVKEFNVDNKKLLPLGDGFHLFGWKPGWIFYYIIFSIPISLGLKKLLKVV